MAFKSLFIAHAPDADCDKHQSMINTGKLKILIVVVNSQDEAIKIAKQYYDKEKIDGITLCPGFTHGDVAEIFRALEGKVSVSVARGDGPSNQITQPVLQKEFFNK